ncbi:putative quinol monooxygenase [Subtercola endophyticus]|uniref:putative quinol monooxygenase n=1 Tax=Subtercola endophyticus TaxID=2895559 RepID=UPI001E60ACCD|nr:putative quinol monooxygenase [Subtercola endophyticus]UFS58782.1 antibiotic biosynthesis monooxygenase [Subtercola endophyticus]
MAFVCNAIWTVKPGSEEIVSEAIAQLSPATRTEPGNIYYQSYVDPAVPNVFRIFEVYKDADAFAAHATYDHFIEHALGKAIPELESRVREIYETLDV